MYENEIFNAANDEKMMSVKNMLDSISHLDTNGNPFWCARDLMGVLGYAEWRKFESLIERSINDSNFLHSAYPRTPIKSLAHQNGLPFVSK